MQYLIQLLISGLAIGAIYGLIAMGFAVIYKSTGLVNFAQGEMTMITAYRAFGNGVDGGSTGRSWRELIRPRARSTLPPRRPEIDLSASYRFM